MIYNNNFIFIYKHPLFKIIFLYLLYIYGSYNYYLTLFLATIYIIYGSYVLNL
jgi:hypothetical protein